MLIGLTGKAGSGKDSTAGRLVARHGFKSVSFANPIRAGLQAVLGLTDAHFAHPFKEVVLKVYGKSPREMMQSLGTTWGRESVTEDLWLILASKKITEYRRLGYNVVITDVRFDNEADMIREMGGEVWHIMRDSAGTEHAHVSEHGVMWYEEDTIIENNSSLKELYRQVDLISSEVV